MDTKALRQKILDLAIRGKLVPQDPNDEPASVLLERIRAEKQQMVKDGKLKPKDIKNDTIIFKGEDNLHYEKFPDGSMKCIEDEIPFELPQGWEWARIRNISTVKGGKRLPKGMSFSESPTDHAYIRVTDMKNNTVITTDLRYITDDVYEKIKNYTISKDDLYVTIAGTIGVVGEVPDELNGMNLTENAVKITDITINKTFLCLLIQSEFVQQQFVDKTHQVAMPKLALERILSTLIPICPISEQLSIISKFNELSLLVNDIQENKQELIDTISLTKSKILDLAIRGKLVPQDPNDEPASVLLERIRTEKEELIKQGKIKRDKKESVIFRGDDNSYYEKIGDTITCIDEELPFELPDGWIWCRGSSCFLPMESRKPSGTYFKYIDIDSIDNKHQAIKKAKITETAKAPSRANRAVFDSSILFSLVRPYLKNIALVDSNNADSIVSTGFYIATSNGTFIPKYLYILMISAYVVNGLNQFMKGDNSPSISKDNIEKWLYPVPPLAEQEKIADIVQKYIRILEDIEKSLS